MTDFPRDLELAGCVRHGLREVACDATSEHVSALFHVAQWLANRIDTPADSVPDEEIRESADRWGEFKRLATPAVVASLCSYVLAELAQAPRSGMPARKRSDAAASETPREVFEALLEALRDCPSSGSVDGERRSAWESLAQSNSRRRAEWLARYDAAVADRFRCRDGLTRG